MKLLLRVWLICSFAFELCPGQNRPMTLDQVSRILENKDFEVSEIMKMLESLGADFELSEANLSALLEAARKGDKPARDVSQLVFMLLKSCRTCRDQLWGPLTKDDILNLLKKGSSFTLAELGARGMKEPPADLNYLEAFRRAGAKDDLIGAIDDRVVIQPPADFKPLPVQKAASFSPIATEGVLTLRVEVDGQIEVLFRHNAVFWKAIKGAAPKDLGSTFTAFGPKADENLVDWNVQQVQPKPGKPKKGKQPAVTGSFVSDPSGRNGFRISITNSEKKSIEYEVQVHWKVLNTPKPARAD